MVMARIALSLLLCFPALAGRADMIDTDSLKPWETCALCHGLDGISRMGKFPKLANQPYAYLVKQLEDIRADRRTNDNGMMSSNAELLTPKALHAVARYFSEQPAPNPDNLEPTAVGRILFEKGEPNRSIPACKACHNASPLDNQITPRLEGQHAEYLAKQLRDFQDDTRNNDINQVMRRIAGQLSAAEIEAVANFASSSKRQ